MVESVPDGARSNGNNYCAGSSIHVFYSPPLEGRV